MQRFYYEHGKVIKKLSLFFLKNKIYSSKNPLKKGIFMMKRSFLFLTVCIFFIPSITFASSLPGGPESLDTSFNSVGYLYQNPQTFAQSLQAVTIQPDNKSVYAGYIINESHLYTNGIVMRLLEDGILDPTFGTDGQGYTIFTLNSNNTRFNGIALQPDGKIVVCGSNFDGANTINALTARFTAAGILDTTTYNQNQGYHVCNYGSSRSAELYDVALQSDGSIVTVGYVGATYTGTPYTQANLLTSYPVVARYTTGGILDTTFNSPNGYNRSTAITIPSGTYNNASHNGVVIRDDGTIFAIGTAINTTYWPSDIHTLPIPALGAMYLTSYNTSGTIVLIPTYPYGYTNADETCFTSAFKLRFQLDNKIVVAANNSNGAENTQYMVTRISTAGAPDLSFNTTGYNSFPSPTDTGQGAYNADITLQANQKIVADWLTTTDNDLFIVRFNTNGSIDSSCDFTFTETGYDWQSSAIAIDLNGKIVCAGSAKLISSEAVALAAFRFIGGQTPQPGPTVAINLYRYNPLFLSEFLYVNTYAQTIIDPTAQAATITTVNDLVEAYILAYNHQQLVQSNFNFITYLYLMKTGLLAAQVILLADYAGSTTEINQFFDYLFERIEILAA